MSQTVHLEVFYPHPPERVWRVLTDRRALADWMMDNDFEPKLGHKFQFRSQPLPGLTTTIQCEVVELEEPTRLVYTWKEPAAEPSLVVWTLDAVPGGTQLRLKHLQHSYAIAAATLNRLSGVTTKHHSKETASFYNYSGLRHSKLFHPDYGSASSTATLEISAFQAFHWEYYLNQTLPAVLIQHEPPLEM
ncbi:MAG: SRPBCC domain-containing protein [Oculatellaceae cyanobacterium bins.114]|nr:SRPBCC domain-containing protein [Oculatellaceae cyanobacterium bins.114]